MPIGGYYTTKEAADILGLAQDGVQDAVRRGVLQVERLARLAYGPIRLGELPVGKWRSLTPVEERAIYRAIHLKPGPE